MPVFVEDPAQFSKEKLKSELIANNVELPPEESNKHIYLELYLKNVKTNSPDFSSDEEDDGSLNDNAEKEEVSDMVDLHLLTDDQLKARLIQYGVKPGPIIASTRALYEKKLHRLMEGPAQTSQRKFNGTAETGQYSDSEEDAEEDKESESEQFRSETVFQTKRIKTASRVGTSCQSRGFYPQCFLPSAGWEPVSDVLSEMFPDCAKTLTGIYATKRRPIKGAAGRPVQYKYPEMPPLSPTTLERQEIQQRLVPLWVQIVVFLLVTCLLYLIYSSMEEPLSNPFSALLDGLQEKPGLISSTQDTPAA
ncbi:LEM domain-containing protein 1 isoform X2 [Triplophysa rosa]|uniref:LEM domain-containing protein 1 isoform X2 n=1 Tax=Triplophysa rosa TaxID=992332 RepID=UPI002545E1A4|nr:LEM domain-containing protein 1 isoform X2 [Triplophysa rosa]